MALEKITAKFACDECGKFFLVEMDPAGRVENYETLFDYAEDELRGGCGVAIEDGTYQLCSIQNDKYLCHDCTIKADDEAEGQETQKGLNSEQSKPSTK